MGIKPKSARSSVHDLGAVYSQPLLDFIDRAIVDPLTRQNQIVQPVPPGGHQGSRGHVLVEERPTWRDVLETLDNRSILSIGWNVMEDIDHAYSVEWAFGPAISNGTVPKGNAPVRKMCARHGLSSSDSTRLGIKSDGPDCRPRIARKAYKQTGATTDVEEPAGVG